MFPVFWSAGCCPSLYKVSNSIFTPHRSTTYVDAACCYRTSSVFSLVCQSVCPSVTLVIPAKMSEPVEMPFGLGTRAGPGNHVLDGGPVGLVGSDFSNSVRFDSVRFSVSSTRFSFFGFGFCTSLQ